MIDLTPLEVRQKKGDFRRAFRGYDAELVNDFLDLVADRMEELVKENMGLRDSVSKLDSEVVAYRDKERALSDALMSAQRLREDARSHAEKEGELMIREARLAAETAREEAIRALAREEEALRQARARRARLVESFRRLLERELGELTVIEEALELEDVDEHGDAPTDAPDTVADAPAERAPKTERKARGQGRKDPEVEETAQQEDWLSSLVEE